MKSKLFFAMLVLVLLLSTFAGTAAAAEEEQRSQFVTPIMIVNTSFLNVRTGPGAQYTVLLTVVGGTELPVLGVAEDRVWYQVSTVAGIGWVNSQFTLARGDFTNVPVVDDAEVLAALEADLELVFTDDAFGVVGFSSGRDWGISITETHSLRVGPTISRSSIGTANADLNVIYPVLEATTADGLVWYRVEITGVGTGWVEAPKTRMRPFACSSDFSVVVLNKDISPSRGPDGTGTLDGSFPLIAGTEAYLLDHREGQFKIELMDGNIAWIGNVDASVRENDPIRRDYCNSVQRRNVLIVTGTGETTSTTTTTAPRLQGPRAIINTAFLNVRSGPGAQYSVVTTLSGGTEVPIIGIAPDGVWYLITGTFGEGWINNEFVLFRGNGTRIPTVRDFVGATLARPVVEITNAVTLFAAPNPTLGTIGALSGPIEVDIVARSADGNWVQIASALGFGWVRTSEVTVSGDLTLVPTVGG